MYNHSGTTDFLKLLSVLLFIGVAVWWLDGAIGKNYTVLVIFALVGVLIFAGGALFSHANQKMTLDAITKFNANDAKIDGFRMQSIKAMAIGDAHAKRNDKLVTEQVKRLTDAEAAKVKAQYALQLAEQKPAPADAWTWDDDNAGDFQTWG
jgi:divalent metal cation (Fe/Co/Zn/Cd) transporter